MKTKIYIFRAVLFLFFLAASGKLLAQESEQLKHDILLFTQEKSSRTPAERKMSSQLLQALRESRGQQMVPGINTLVPADVKADNTGAFEVDLKATVTDDLIGRIENLGGTILFASAEYNAIRAKIKFTMVETIAGYTDVKFIEPAQLCETVGKGLVDQYKSTNPFLPAIPFTRADRIRTQLTNYLKKKNLVGTINSQGDRTHRADDAKGAYGYEGQGIRIGIISDSYNNLGNATTDIAGGNLPGVGNPLGNTTPITVIQESGTTDEGRAMLQLVHDIVPKAQLFFATANGGQANFAANIQNLRNAPNNCDIIIDDVSYFAEAAFQDGVIAQAVNTVTAGGALYFSSAGNSGSVLRGTSGVFEGDFNDAGSPAFTHPGGVKVGSIHNFGTVGSPVNGDIITSAPTSVYNLHWADPIGGSGNDYDLFLVSSTGTIKGQSTTTQAGGQDPYEQITALALATGDRLVVFKTTAAQLRAFSINANRGALTVVTNGQTHGHGSATAAFSVAATPAAGPFGATVAGPFPGAFTGSNQVETFSSDGPRRIFYLANGTAITPGNLLFGTSGGELRSKPDITAADGTSTSMPTFSTFYGTSAAAPHAGAIAALLKSANPALTTTQIRTALTSTAIDIEAGGYDNNSGIGIIQAFQAMQSISPTPLANITLGTTTVTEGVNANGTGGIDPGEGGNLVVQLLDPSSINATSVNAVLTTSTAGVTINNGSFSYGIIAGGGSGINTGSPFTFTVSNSVTCGTTITFVLTVTFSGGGVSPKSFFITVPVGTLPAGVVNGTMWSSPPTLPGVVTTSGNQTGRVARSGTTSSCASPKSAPGLTVATGARPYHAYTLTNTGAGTQCVTVTLNSTSAANVYSVAYNASGFVPANPNTNYLADDGIISGGTHSYSFNVAAATSFTVVVHDLNTAPVAGTYTLNVSLTTCTNVIPVKWLTFDAKLQGKQVALEWKVANELNVTRYEVEYGTDGSNFSKLYTVAATANVAAEKTYDQLHPFPAAGNNYYRIKQIDADGRFSYSKTILIRMDKANTVMIAPNPARSFVTIEAKSPIRNIQLFDATGQLLLKVNASGTTYKLPVAQFPAGQYFVRVETADGIVNEKITKE